MSPGACPLGVRRINRVLLYSQSYCEFDNLVPRVHLQKTKNTEEDDSIGYHRQPCANACHVVPTLASLVKETDIPTYSSKSRFQRLILRRKFLPIVLEKNGADSYQLRFYESGLWTGLRNQDMS